jgi:hypothetical protein
MKSNTVTNFSKFISILTLLLTFALSVFAQMEPYPKGIYRSIEEIRTKSPSEKKDLDVEKRTNGEIKMNGGNDYKLSSSDNTIPKNIIKKEILAYSDGDSLYINCLPLKVQPWYATVLSDGRFLVIRAGLSMNPKLQREQLKNRAQLGMLFGAIGGGIEGAKRAMMRFVYIVDKESFNITAVSTDYLTELLSPYPDLSENFKNEKEKSNQEIFIKYLCLINLK